MKIVLTTLCFLFLATGNSLAETRYVSDILVVTVRAQPERGAEVLTTVRTATPLEVIKDLNEYLLIRTDEGIEGYISSQYVTTETPKIQQIEQLKTQLKELRQENTALTEKADQSTQYRDRLAQSTKELSQLKTEHTALKQASGNVLQLTQERDLLKQENSAMATRLEQLKEESNLYLRTGIIKWFLAGAGVLFFGWILGKMSGKKKRFYR